MFYNTIICISAWGYYNHVVQKKNTFLKITHMLIILSK